MPRTKQPKIIPSALIPGTQLPRPTIDLVFKTMLENTPAALKSLITAVLQPESPIEFVTILSPELNGPDINSKQSRLDFIELPKISALNPSENPLFSAWVQFLGAKSADHQEFAAHSIPEIHQLVGELNKMSADKEFIDLINKNEVDRIIAQRANAEALRDARDEGKAKTHKKNQVQFTD